MLAETLPAKYAWEARMAENETGIIQNSSENICGILDELLHLGFSFVSGGAGGEEHRAPAQLFLPGREMRRWIAGVTGWQLNSYLYHECARKSFWIVRATALAPLSGAGFRTGREAR
ncbi:MAG: hypothetical protein ACLVJ6_15625 [Merdibacter sp.]